jgi:hypothetical protein
LRYSRTTRSGRSRRPSSQYSSASARALEHLEVALDDLVHAGPQDLDDDLLAVAQRRGVHLGDRGRRERRRSKLANTSASGPERRLDGRGRDRAVERRDPVLQLRQLIGDVDGQQVAARRQGLAEFHEDRPELLEREPQPLAARDAGAALKPGPRRQIEQEPQRPVQMRRAHEIVEAVPNQRALDLQQAADDAQAHQAPPFRRMLRGA